MAPEKYPQATQQIAELVHSIYQIEVAIVEKTAMKSMLEERNTTFQEKRKKKTEAETKFKESINQIQDIIDAKKSEQRLRQNQMLEATSIKKKEWLKECIDNLQKSIAHLEEGLKGRQNNLTEIETTFSQFEQDFVSRKHSIAELEKNIVLLEEGLKTRQNALLTLKK